MTYAQARKAAAAQVRLLAPSIPGVSIVVPEDATVIPDQDSDGFGAFVAVFIGAKNQKPLFSLLAWIESDDEVTDAGNDLEEQPGCGQDGPEGYRCTHHSASEHLARGTEDGSLGEAWPLAMGDAR